MGHRIGVRQRWAWTAASTLAVVCACACGMDWLWVLTGGLIAALSQYFLDRHMRDQGLAHLLRAMGDPGKGLAALSLVWFVGVLAWSANLADLAFPMVDGFPLLGLTILALAAWGSWQGPAACGRCAAILLLFILPLLGTVTAFAVPDVELRYLLPEDNWREAVGALGLFLLPSGLWMLPCRRRKPGGSWLYLLLPVGGAVLAAVTAGVLSPMLASRMTSPLYTVVKSVSLFGVMERIEPLLSVAMTMGAFCLVSSAACAVGALAAKRWAGPAACGLAALLMGPAGAVGPEILAAGGGIFGVVLPVMVVMMTKRGQKRA